MFTVNAMRLGPPGPFFFVLTACISSVVTGHGVDVSALVIATCAGGLSSLIVGMAPALWRPEGPQTAATLAAIGQMGAVWTGGGTLVAWSSLIAVAGFARVPVFQIVRTAMVPVLTGLAVSTVCAVLIWH